MKEEKSAIYSICGLLVTISPAKVEQVTKKMLEIEGVEIQTSDEAGKYVVTVESDSYQLTGDRVTEVHNIEGILSVSVIYQMTDEVEDEEAA